MIKNKKRISTEELTKELAKVNIFRKVRLAYALKYRISNPEAILYENTGSKLDVTYLLPNTDKSDTYIPKMHEINATYQNDDSEKPVILPATEIDITKYYTSKILWK